MDVASCSKIENRTEPEERKSIKRKYESPSASPCKNQVDDDINNVAKRQESRFTSRWESDQRYDDIEVSSQDFAFAIDDIFEQILNSVDKSSLFQCRLVSHRWRTVSTKILKKVGSGIEFRVTKDPPFVLRKHRRGYDDAEGGSLKPMLSDLTSFLKESYNQGSPFNMDTFPINYISLSNCSLCNPELQSFLDTWGKYLGSLHVDSTPCEAQCESDFIKQVENLLGAQAPNLRSLSFFELNLKNITPATGSNSTGIRQNESELNEIRMTLNTKLRYLSLRHGSRKVLDRIIAISPTLREIDLDCRDYYLLSEPTNLLHFLTRFHLTANVYNKLTWMNFKFLEAAILISPEERQLRNIPPMKCTYLDIDFDKLVNYVDSHEDVRLSFVRMINKVLEDSWDTLKHVDFANQTAGTLKGLQWPRVLPNVTWIASQPIRSCGLEIFPLDGNFKIQDTFPRLKRIYYDVSIEKIQDSSAAEFLMKLNLGPVTTVTSVIVNVATYPDSAYRDWTDETHEDLDLYNYYSEKLLNKLFSNADADFKFYSDFK